MKKFAALLLVVLLALTLNILTFAHGADNYYIKNYSDLLEWKNAGCPGTVLCIYDSANNFGWPQSPVELDFSGHGFTHGLPVRSTHFTIPENVTIKNLSLSIESDSSLTVNGKLLNNYKGVGADHIVVVGTAVTIGKNAKVTGVMRLCCGSSLVSNGGYVDEVMSSMFISSSSTNDDFANISGALNVNTLSMNDGMDMNILAGSDITVDRIIGSNETNFNINNRAIVKRANTYSGTFRSNIKLCSGGVLYTFCNYPCPEYTLTIEEGGIINAYEGFSIASYNKEGCIKGKGTINLYGWNVFRYLNFNESGGMTETDYSDNPGNIPDVDPWIVINYIEICDHANGMAFYPQPLYSEVNGEYVSLSHKDMCVGCGMETEGTEAPHQYEPEDISLDGIYYKCVCGANYFSEIISGECGKDVRFEYRDATLTISGNGATDEYLSTDAPWFTKQEKIEKVSISSGITSVGKNAFKNCNLIKTVEYDGSYDDWKNINIESGNENILYADIVFNDNSRLLAPIDNCCGKNEFLLKTGKNNEEKSFTLEIKGEIDMPVNIYTVFYNQNGKYLGRSRVNKSEDNELFSGSFSSENETKLLIWSDLCEPLTNFYENEL